MLFDVRADRQQRENLVFSCWGKARRWMRRESEARLDAEEFPLACPNCGGDIRLISFIIQPQTSRKILTHVGESLEPPLLSLA